MSEHVAVLVKGILYRSDFKIESPVHTKAGTGFNSVLIVTPSDHTLLVYLQRLD